MLIKVFGHYFDSTGISISEVPQQIVDDTPFVGSWVDR